MAFEKLFKPIRIGKVNIRNRVAMAPMATLSSDRGYVTEQQLAHYAARARGGAGLIIIECTFVSKWGVDNSYYNNLVLYDMSHMRGMTELAEAIHAFRAKAFIQLTPGFGVQGSSRRTGVQPVAASAVNFRIPPAMVPKKMWENSLPPASVAPIGAAEREKITQTVAGLPLDFPSEKLPELLPPQLAAHMGPMAREVLDHLVGEVPREMTIEEIEREQENFVKAAEMARTVGFDGIEIHAPHGYLLHDFLSPRFNRRTDRYGGGLENRMRFLLELVRKTKAAVENDIVLGVRASADEHMPGGTTYEDMKIVVQRLEQEGIDYFHVSDGSYEALKYFLPEEDGTMLEEAAGFKKLLSIPVITPSIHDPEKAEKAITQGMTDMVALGRQLLADPDWANKVKEGRVADIRKCDRCYRGCIMRLTEGLPVRCYLNPESGLERYNPDYTPWAVKRRAIEKRQAKPQTVSIP
jgi:2,4-dienoyl-CoA reductase-like NADH-dependent reductase (Old Yellow Enzyme family)